MCGRINQVCIDMEVITMPENYITISGEKGNINISEDVISLITAAAIAETEGVAGLSNNVGAELSDFLGKKTISKGIKVSFEEGSVKIDALIMVRMGYGVAAVANKVQEAVTNAVESVCGLTPAVNVHITGVAFEK